ncbi:hypothetical protein GCK72_024871 [Caenorhabditis remanei]|uniref:Ig-like domain-containing protein n=1 Tax=Caenorhabditis remanei TaxID=31234 RepID=A0A6A5G197_CAERE|nr:hypothetical protein GCK72_024871 [Caenorhabditis remanei]KAF1748404.1 hypothetical protein GCK72_024871 [Caenorhabditis remanei]
MILFPLSAVLILSIVAVQAEIGYDQTDEQSTPAPVIKKETSVIKFLETPLDINITDGKPVYLSCTVFSTSSVVIEWDVNYITIQGEPDPFNEYQILNVGKKQNEEFKTTSILKLCNPRSGRYTCTASNNFNNISTSIELENMSEECKDDNPWKPNIYEYTPWVKEFYGRSVTLRCKSEGYFVDRSWSRNRRKIEVIRPKYEVNSDGSLVIHDLDEKDEGNYTCSASNDFGQDTKMTVVSKGPKCNL